MKIAENGINMELVLEKGRPVYLSHCSFREKTGQVPEKDLHVYTLAGQWF